MKTKIFIFILLIVLINSIEAKVFGQCELAKELHRQGIPKSELGDWLCLVEGESSYNTAAINRANSDSSWDWGLFQINDRYWCDSGKQTANVCKIKCDQLLTDDITASVNCARKIKQIHGFSAWVAWSNRCKGKALPNAKKCF